ncbi:trichohyalin-like [Hypanus sabinus]|uniref:trichohyalin-like n=1 Tax=Hypanus sabinus TaxID=79690 RepID=UPI0028C388FA|nr:trichohyalin-like [Hypanus sabinus]
MDVDEFIENPTLEALEAATKSDLIDITKGLNLAEVRLSMKKREVRRAITQYIVKNVFSAEVLENIPEKAPASGTAQLELEKLRMEHEIKLKQLEAAEKEKERAEKEKERAEKEKAQKEKERTEREKETAEKQREHELQLKELEVKREHALQLKELEEKREQERAEKQREHEIQLKQLEAAEKEKERAEKEKEREYEEKEKQRQHDLDMEKLRQERRAQGPDQEERFNVSREFRLVPPFEETDADSYFLHFEKVAVNQKWPRDQWVALIQSVLKGKAQQAYAALSMEEEESENYEKVKEAILRAYELVPEVYRQKFRNFKERVESEVCRVFL